MPGKIVAFGFQPNGHDVGNNPARERIERTQIEAMMDAYPDLMPLSVRTWRSLQPRFGS